MSAITFGPVDGSMNWVTGSSVAIELQVDMALVREPLGVRTSAGVHMLRYAIRNDKDFENFSPSTRRRARLLTAAAGVLNLVQINIDF